MKNTQNRAVTWVRILAVLLFAASPTGVFACRIIIPPWPPPPWHPPPLRPIPRPPRQPADIQVKKHHAIIDVKQHVADVTVDAVFHNPNPFQIEGTYVFPVGREAAVFSFTMTMNGKTLEAELLDAESAREIYEDIVRRLKDPALLEYAGEGLLKARVFPIEANSDVRIRLTYEVAAGRKGDLTRVRYPLLSAKPGGEEVVQDARIEVNLATDVPIKSIFAPGFDVAIDRDGNRRATVVWQAENIVPDRDFELLYNTDKGRVGIEFLSYKDAGEGYFLMFVAPDSELQAEEIEAKEIIFVMDTSGSMMGEKIRQAQKALTFCIDALNPQDRFNIIAFSTDVNPFMDDPVRASNENRRQARDFVEGLRPRGGTAIHRALKTAFESPPPSDRPSFVVFLTDGMPTVGETDPAIIMKEVQAAASDERRLFAFGVGYDVNTRLLDGLAQKVRGDSSYVRPKENLEIALSSFYEKIAHPVLTELNLKTRDVRLTDMNPPELPDLFRGSEIRVTGRYRGSGEQSMVLSGEVAGTRENIRFEADLDGNRRNTFIPRMWAISRVGYLQEQIRINGRQEELVNEIKRLGRKYGIVTEFTSLLIVEENVDRQRLSEARRAFQNAQTTAGEAETGPAAVEGAMRSKSLQQSAYDAGGMGGASGGVAGDAMSAGQPVIEVYKAAGFRREEVAAMVKHVGDKTFYLRQANNTWYDSLIPPGETPEADVTLEAWSDAFFEWVRNHPALATYMRVGDRLMVIIDGKTIEVTPGT